MIGFFGENYEGVFIIAEAGVNHNGSLKNAIKMIDVAKNAGADAIKFQTFTAERLVTPFAQKAEYQFKDPHDRESQLKMLKRFELDSDFHKTLYDYCKNINIEFLSSAFDIQSLKLLKTLGLRIYKIPSGEITNLPLLRKIGSLKVPIIMSTGMSNMNEIKAALDVLFKAGAKKNEICLLQCNSDYPTQYKDVNLLAALTMKDKFGVEIGLSDHTIGIEVPIAAAALGAVVIEKHFTLNKNMEGPDHSASLSPEELTRMVCSIRNVENAIGDGHKKVNDSEKKNIDYVRKSIVALRDINIGEVYTEENITTKRPGHGLSPMLWDDIIGKKAKRSIKKDEFI